MYIHAWLTEATIAGNELWRIMSLFMILLAAFGVGKLASYFMGSMASRQEKGGSPVIAAALRALASAMGFIALAVGLEIVLCFDILVLNDAMKSIADTTVNLLFIIAIAWLAYRLVDVVDCWLGRLAARTDSKVDDMLVPLVRKTLRITIVILALLQVATSLSDKPVTSLLAGLGIGGLAVALAAQDTLKNFFGSLLILADKPFEIGDRIVVDEHDGPVEEIGFRSTRIRTLEGHLVTVPNSEMASKAIQNIGKRRYIRRLFTVSITYDTPPDMVQRAVDIIKDILKNHEGENADFPPRVFFNEFADCSLNILVIYWYHPPSYWDFLAFSERVNMEILRRFNEEGIEFAFPSRTLYVAGDPNRPLNVGTGTQPIRSVPGS